MAANENRPIGEWPNISAEMWLTLAIVVGFFAAIACGGMLFWILSDQDPAVMAARARVFTPVAALSVALVTFFTIAWRGKITERQAKIAQDQLQETQNQNTAELLQKGAELIWEEVEFTNSEEDAYGQIKNVVMRKPHLGKAAAGIVSLGIVAKGTDDELAIQSMNILADFLQNNFKHEHEGELCLAVIAALRAGQESAQPGGIRRIADRYLSFSASHQGTRWSAISGTAGVSYTDGVFTGLPGGAFDFFTDGKIVVQFCKVKFEYSTLDFYFSPDKCSFDNCNIKLFICGAVEANTFINCNFSDCLFVGNSTPSDLREGNNYFRPGRPPKANIPVDWEDILHVRNPKK